MASVFDVFATLVLNRLNAGNVIVNKDGTPSRYFLSLFNNQSSTIETHNTQFALSIEEFASINNLYLDAQAKADAAEKAFNDFTAQVADANAAQALASSYINPTNVLTASSSGASGSITIANHSRVYSDGTTVTVNGATISGLASGASYYVFYNDANRTGGAVSYLTSTDPTAAVQTGIVHSVGTAFIPTTAGTTRRGYGNAGPGVMINPDQ